MEGQGSLLEASVEEEALTVLHYEEQITELLVVIAELNRKINRLTMSTIREEDEYLDTFSDLSDTPYLENNSFLCPDLGQPTVSDCPGQPCQIPGSTGEPSELSQKLQQVLTELEETVRTRRTEIPQLCADPAEEEQSALTHWQLVTQVRVKRTTSGFGQCDIRFWVFTVTQNGWRKRRFRGDLPNVEFILCGRFIGFVSSFDRVWNKEV
ncbi:colorectal mutant cancer protein-like [Rhincodon typus]|uniref:colorectal mutant cancer protein-like n=1 Tax=Rhincodon typus TaxID=259920 RepID=UPI00202FF0B4|nr:colorectal mutant cancer protein-like [Rhincodon typus]